MEQEKLKNCLKCGMELSRRKFKFCSTKCGAEYNYAALKADPLKYNKWLENQRIRCAKHYRMKNKLHRVKKKQEQQEPQHEDKLEEELIDDELKQEIIEDNENQDTQYDETKETQPINEQSKGYICFMQRRRERNELFMQYTRKAMYAALKVGDGKKVEELGKHLYMARKLREYYDWKLSDAPKQET